MPDPIPFRWSQWTHPRTLARFHIAVDIHPDRQEAKVAVRPLQGGEERTWTLHSEGVVRPSK